MDGFCSKANTYRLTLHQIYARLDPPPKKQRHHFADKVSYSQSYGFPVVTCRCETWTIKKVEHRRTDAFELWCWRRLLRVPWTARRSNQSILKEINPEYSLEDWCQSWSSNTLGTGCKEPIHWKKPWCWKDWRQKEEGEAEDEMVR